MPFGLRYSVSFLFLSLVFCSCKKDLLHFQNVTQINSNTTTDRLNKILFTDNTNGFVVGGQRFMRATMLTTRDGGYTWNNRSFPQDGKEIFNIAKGFGNKIYTIGFESKVLVSSDTGKNWVFRQMGFGQPLTAITYISPNLGIAVGGISFDAGYFTRIDSNAGIITWDSLGYQLNDIKMVSPQSGYICGYGVMKKTTDSGKTWNVQQLYGDNFTAIYIITENDVWVCGKNGGIFHTNDGGNSWSTMRNGNNLLLAQYHLNDIVFIDDMNGWCVGDNGLVIRTDDGGIHWMEYDKFTGNALYGITKCPNGDLMVCGESGALYRLSVN